MEDFYLLMEEHIVYDLNWLYFRRKIISFNQFLNLIIQTPIKIISLNLKIIWYKYCIWFNGVVNNG